MTQEWKITESKTGFHAQKLVEGVAYESVRFDTKQEAETYINTKINQEIAEEAMEEAQEWINEAKEKEEQTMNTNTKVNEEQRAFFFRMGYNDAQRHAIKYGIDDVGTMIGDYIKVVNVQHSWDEMEFAYVEGMLTYLEAQKIPQEA